MSNQDQPRFSFASADKKEEVENHFFYEAAATETVEFNEQQRKPSQATMHVMDDDYYGEVSTQNQQLISLVSDLKEQTSA